eukprot:TRINITY_DN32603_c0_g1_i4.p1 TRINITY_DN32603_c0_g1~~TRINITY_DN32603_c0_g1_i4.p1  ORF type:complete len:538 (+),score=117.57 TRINITY_DN32603_c0_g1_i4:77-1690(+)
MGGDGKKGKGKGKGRGRGRGALKKQLREQSYSVSTAELESIVFGGSSLEKPPRQIEEEEDEDDQEDDAIPEQGDKEENDDDSEAKAKKPEKKRKLEEKKDPTPAAAWNDPDDAELEVDVAKGRLSKLQRNRKETKLDGNEYEKRLRQQFVKIHGSARWVDQKDEVADEDTSDSEDEGLTKVAATSKNPLAPKGSGHLPERTIELSKLKDLEIVAGQKKGPAAVEVLQFHPTAELIFTGGRDKTLRMYAIDSDENPKVASYHFKDFPILGASFTNDGSQVIMTGIGSQIWGLDVQSGESFEVRNATAAGRIHYHGLAMGPSRTDSPSLKSSEMFSLLGHGGELLICDSHSKHTIRTLRMSSKGVAAVFAPDRDTIYSADSECNIYEWDLSTGRCRQKVKDAWATHITQLAVRRATDHAPKTMLAVGTSTGNIDLLDASTPKISGTPEYSIGNLTTRIDALRFHPEGELLGACSRMKKGSLKLVHMGTSSVFANWPTVKTPIERASALDFSRQGGLMAIGNENGRVLVYRLRHYDKATR